MKTAITVSYTFNPASGTLNLSGISGFNIDLLYEVIDLTTNQTIYDSGVQALGYSALSGTTLTLKANMAGLSAGDVLQVIYDETVSGGGGGSDPAAGATGSPVPAYVSYTGFQNAGGNLVGVSPSNPMPITGAISATNPSVGPTGAVAPGSVTYMGILSGGNLVGWNGGTSAALGSFVTGFSPDLGTIADSAWSGSGSASLNAIGKATYNLLKGTLSVGGTVAISGSVAVTGAFYQATQPISGNVGINGSVAVTGTFYQATQPISGTVTIGAGSAIIGGITAPAAGAWAGADGYAQGSATSGQYGPLGQAAVVAGAATYTAGQTSPLVMTTTGSLRVLPTSTVGGVPIVTVSNGLAGAGAGQQPALLFNTTPGQVASGVASAQQGDSFGGAHSVSRGSPDAFVGLAPITSVTSSVLGKSSGGNRYGYSVVNGATAGFLCFLNVNAVPAASAAITPIDVIPVAANAGATLRQMIPDYHSTGIVAVFSSSTTTYTALTPLFMSLLVK